MSSMPIVDGLTFKSLSFCVLIFVAVGFFYRRHQRVHIFCMSVAFAIDLIILLSIELSRNAFQTASEMPHPFVAFHIFISVVVLALYVAQIFLGIRLKKWELSRSIHRWLGFSFLVFRIGNFVTSLVIERFIQR